MQPLQPPKKPRSAGKVIAYIVFGFFLLMIPIALNINMESRSSDEPAVEDSSEETVPADTVAEEPEPVVEEEVAEEPAVTPELEQEYATFYDSQIRPYQQAYDSLWAQWQQVPTQIASGGLAPDQGLARLNEIANEYDRMSSELNALSLPDSFPGNDQSDMSLAFSDFADAMHQRAMASTMLAAEIAMVVSSNGTHQVDMSQVEGYSDRADESLLKATATFVTVSQTYGHDPR